MNEQDIQVNRQLYLLDQKVELITEVLSEIYDALYFAEDSNGNDLMRSSGLAFVKSQLEKLRGLPDD